MFTKISLFLPLLLSISLAASNTPAGPIGSGFPTLTALPHALGPYGPIVIPRPTSIVARPITIDGNLCFPLKPAPTIVYTSIHPQGTTLTTVFITRTLKTTISSETGVKTSTTTSYGVSTQRVNITSKKPTATNSSSHHSGSSPCSMMSKPATTKKAGTGTVVAPPRGTWTGSQRKPAIKQMEGEERMEMVPVGWRTMVGKTTYSCYTVGAPKPTGTGKPKPKPSPRPVGTGISKPRK